MVDLLSGLGGIGKTFMTVGIVLVVIILVLVVGIGLFFLFKRWRNYSDFVVRIWEVLESGGIREAYDKAGIFLNTKTGNKLFYLKRLKVGLNPDKLMYLNDSKGKRIVYLLRYGFKNFVFINPFVKDVGDVRFKVGEEDVNWAVNSYEASKKRFSQSLLFQMLPFMVLALVCIIILILMVTLFKNFSVFSSVAESFNQATQTLIAYNTNAGVVPSGGVI